MFDLLPLFFLQQKLLKQFKVHIVPPFQKYYDANFISELQYAICYDTSKSFTQNFIQK